MVYFAVFSVPCNDLSLTTVFHCAANDAIELGRFLLLDSVPSNGETWFLARCFDLLRSVGLVGVTTFSDPIPRRTLSGTVVHPGHIGTIFQAFNGRYLGRGTARTLRLLPDGTVFSERAIQKVRTKEPGWRYACARLQSLGATSPGDDTRVWLQEWLPLLTRPLRHPGNHRYAWPLTKTAERAMATSLPYPKFSSLSQ